jgi:sulfate adenylyltransferase subunit 2
MNDLDWLESQSVYILREAKSRFERLAMLWSLGKDSNVMIWLAKKAFLGRVPFPVVHLDTGLEFPETYAFRERYAREWNLDLIADDCPPIEATDPSLAPNSRLAARKTLGLSQAIERYAFQGIIAGIRRDEQATRAKERVFSPRRADGAWDFRDQPPEFWDLYCAEAPQNGHVRVHPLLHWTEIDIWRYIRREEIPVVPLYFAREGKRFRSLGEIGITHPIESHAGDVDAIVRELKTIKSPERAGRAMDYDSEDAFERLRVAGYM